MPQNRADEASDDGEGMDGTVREERGSNSTRALHVVWDGGGRTVPLSDGERVVIGRSDECGVVVPLQSVSRRHAVVVGGSPPMIEDAGSANGTAVGARVLRAGEKSALSRGVVARIGSAIVVVDEGGDAEAAATPGDADWVVGSGLAAVLALAARYALGTLSVLVTGETGVGKERIAAYVHERSPRAKRPLLRINCAALPEALLESELFGHERGAFTGASAAKRGLLESAAGGTVFLDEIGEMPLLLQAKMLRAVEAQEVFRVGALRPVPIDVRFVAATNRDLQSLAAEGRFRSDLYYRLGAAVLDVPPLRERRDEIIPLAEAFLERARRVYGRDALALAPAAREALLAHPWPGNVRELRNVIERAVLLSDSGVIAVAHLPFGAAPVSSTAVSPRVDAEPQRRVDGADAGLRASVDAEELRRIQQALAEAGGNQTRAASQLGVSRQTLLRRLDKHGLVRPRK